MIIRIDDPDDPRVADYLAVRERDLVGRQGRFVAEGEVVIGVLAGQQRHAILSLLVAEKRLPGLGSLIDRLAPEVPVYAAAPAVIDRIVGFHLHRGLLGIGGRAPEPALADCLASLPARATVVAAIGIANHDNIGGIFRNAAAFGADAVLLDAESCDPLYRKALRVSVGAALLVPFCRGGSAEALLDALEAAGFGCLALSPSGRETLASVARPDRTALLLGAEGPGLPAAVLRRARGVRIPMAPGFDSLNVATASGIALYALKAGD